MYKVVLGFRDKEDGMRRYRPGDAYPRKGYEPDEVRIQELTSSKNRLGKPLIVKTEHDSVNDEDPTPVDLNESEKVKPEKAFPKHTGGGWYELSNGEKVKGKQEAIEAENELK